MIKKVLKGIQVATEIAEVTGLKKQSNEQTQVQTKKSNIKRVIDTVENVSEALLGEPSSPVINIVILDGAIAPILGTDGSAGYDLSVHSKELLENGTKVKYGTGVKMEIPKGYVGLVFPRSSVATKTDLRLSNCVGVIDSDYRGEISAVFDYKEPYNGCPMLRDYRIGERCCQIVIVPYLKVGFRIVNELSETERGENGYGHTGR